APGARLLRSHRNCVERTREDHAARGVSRWRKDMGRCAFAGPRAANLPYAVPLPLALGRKTGGTAKQGHRRDRLRSADVEATDRRARLERPDRFHLSLE